MTDRRYLATARPRPYLRRGALPLNIAHRGGAYEHPESTLQAFEHAARVSHADIFEIDVWLTADESVVIFHDARVDRTTDGAGLIADMTLAQVQALDAGHAFEAPGRPGVFPHRGAGMQIMTLDELLARFPEQRINIDLKDNEPALIDATLAIIDRHQAHQRVGVGSFHDRLMWEVARAAPPELCLTAPMSVIAELIWSLRCKGSVEGVSTADVPFDVLQIPRSYAGLELITPALVRGYHAGGWFVHVWTINDEAEMRALIALDVDGVVTDLPTTFGEVLASV